jgi:hypothetical protein
MHYRYIVVFDKKKAKNSLEARKFVYGYLSNDEEFNRQSDWAVIGGRWSGDLTKIRLDQDKRCEFEADFEKQFGFWTNKDNSEEKRHNQAKELFKKYFPKYKGEPLYFRNTYLDLGFEDDAQIIDEELYEKLIKNCDKDSKGYLDIEDEKLNKEQMIGRWIVLVDYHN